MRLPPTGNRGPDCRQGIMGGGRIRRVGKGTGTGGTNEGDARLAVRRKKIERGGRASKPGRRDSRSCHGCGRNVLTYAEAHAAGSRKLARGRLTTLDALSLSGQQGYRCTGCGRVYCADCLMRKVPAHRSGGKACPACGSAFGRYR
ncbi:MAG: hypothetical protein RDU89_12000 [bacterium]|nr:hypothetical protein [bacterium]